MQVSSEAGRLLALCAIRVDKKSVDWSLIAREASRPGGLANLERGQVSEESKQASEARALLEEGLAGIEAATARVDAELEAASSVGARLVTVLDGDYPRNLWLIFNLPPFLFLRGADITDDDLRAVAVVGTRDASEQGLSKARRLATQLTEAGVTVVSGLARGIDTAAHTATLDAHGRTIAVVGTGITKTYPAENKALADHIVQSGGTLVSQFWPSSGPARWTFPRRNVVMSGIAQGSAVVEASSTSGAKMQARLALEHGKRAFLLASLVTDQPWAQKYVATRGAIEVSDVDDVLQQLADPGRIRDATTSRQLTLDLV